MPNFVAIRTYNLKPDADQAAFEKAFENIKPALGLQKVVLLRGYQGDRVSKGAADYVSLHIFESDEACTAFFRPAFGSANMTELLSRYPEELRPFLQIVAEAHLVMGDIAESTVHGYTPVHDTL